jgi:hypothetical protein
MPHPPRDNPDAVDPPLEHRNPWPDDPEQLEATVRQRANERKQEWAKFADSPPPIEEIERACLKYLQSREELPVERLSDPDGVDSVEPVRGDILEGIHDHLRKDRVMPGIPFHVVADVVKNMARDGKVESEACMLDGFDEPQESYHVPGTKHRSGDQPPSLTRSERRTLLALETFDARQLASAVDIVGVMDPMEELSKATVLNAVKKLIELGLAERPAGSRQGARLTIEGRKLKRQISD